ncbi:zinc finger, CCHC-type containing protein [Tanacetum coccineum]
MITTPSLAYTITTTLRLTKPLDQPKREFRRLRRVAWRLYQNESLAIAGRNLFDDEASSSNNTKNEPPTPLKTLREHSRPNSSGFQNPITIPTEQTRRIVDARDILLIQGTCTFQGLRNEDPLHLVKNYLSISDSIQSDGATRDTSRLRFFYFSIKGKLAEWFDRIPPAQITTWDQLVSRFLEYFFLVGRTSSLRDLILRFKQGDDEPIKSAWARFQDLIKQVPHHGIQKWLLVQIFHDNISLENRVKLDQFTQFWFSSLTDEEGGRLQRACNQITYLETPTQEVGLKTPYLICDYYGGSHEADECEQNNPAEQVCLSGGDIYGDPSLLSFYQNYDTPPWENSKRKEKGEDGPEWVVRSKFEDELANFMLEKKSHIKGI